MNVGFMGLGSMGSEMARSLLRAGHAVRVWNRTEQKTEALVSAGATTASAASDLAGCDAVVVMLANDEANTASIVGSGLLDGMRAPATLLNCSTISVACARELSARFAERGVTYIAAPVLGRPDVAAQGKLNVIAAGADDALARVAPLLEAIGQKTWRVGHDPALANVAKIGCNFLIASAMESMGEAFAIVAGNGLAPKELHNIFSNTLFASPIYKNYGTQILEQRFEPAGFALRLGLKDVKLARRAAESGHAHAPIADALVAQFESAVGAGDGDKDWSAVTLQTKRASAA